MASRTTRDHSAKETRCAPSLGKISPKPLKIDSPDPKARTPTSSDKHVPNYLKPTLSSGLEQQGRKPISSTDAAAASHKPLLNRRRSFDSKPQSPTTQAHRSRASLKPTQRSSSFSGKTTGSDKNSMMRGNKEGAAGSVGTTVKKQQSSVGETWTVKKEENPCTKISDDDAIEIEIKDEEIVQIGEEDQDHRTEAVEIVKDDDQVVINEEAVSTQEDAKEHTTNEENNVNDNNNISSDETAADNVSENTGDKDLKEEEEEAASGESSAILSEDKETKVEEVVVVTKPKTETINTGAAKYQGKRESAVSNDVIEETASKLREQRKNKVKALAGAFETVISLQETKYR